MEGIFLSKEHRDSARRASNPLRSGMVQLSAACSLFLLACWVPQAALGQEFLTLETEQTMQPCRDLSLMAGESAQLECTFGHSNHAYRWISEDSGTLKYLSGVTEDAPYFRAPAGLAQVQQFTYLRIQTNSEGKETGRATVQVIVFPDLTDDCRLPGGTPLKGEAKLRCEEVNSIPASNPDVPLVEWEEEHITSFPLGGVQNRQAAELPETPYLRCDPSITIDGGTETVITCSGQGPSGGFLEYTAEFDWPPYSETVVLASGDFDYTLRAPVITDPSNIRRLDLTALDPKTGLSTTQTVEVHVVNGDPVLQCDDLVVDERTEVAFPCTVAAAGTFRYQFIPQARLGDIPWGLYDHAPSFVAPEVTGDTTVAVIVRVIQKGAQSVAQQQFTMMVRDVDGPASGSPVDLTIECDPPISEVYEGGDDIMLKCWVTSGQNDSFVWTWAAEGDTPLDPLFFDFDPHIPREATFLVPESVDEDTYYEYSVTASSIDLGASNRASILITVLEKPDIAVACQDAQARTGDPPLQLSCTATNEKGLDLSYNWDWQPTEYLLGDLTTTGAPLFEVPMEQTELYRDYVYEVTATAHNADPPEMPTTLTVTVEKILGTLTLACVTPVEVYEGSNDVELDCTVGGAQPAADISWTWQPLAGTEDLLMAHPNRFSGPIFQVPPSVPNDQIYQYALSIHAPNYIGSEPQMVSIKVLTRPELALRCESKVTVHVGDPPRRLFCEASNNKGVDLEYTWEWAPATRLAETDTSTPLFDVPAEQREASVEYPYAVTVTAPYAIPATVPVVVTVVNPDAASGFQVAVSTSALDFGRLGPAGIARLDPGTERLSGLIHGGVVHAGRMLITARDSLALGFELLRPVILRNTGARNTPERPQSLTLMPLWSHAESCVTLAPEKLAETYVRVDMEEGDCRLLRFGGEVTLYGAEPGTYTGQISVLLSIGSIDEIHSVPVSLTVEEERRVVSLGPAGARFGPETAPSPTLESEQTIRIYPLVAALSTREMEGLLEVSNPSVIPLEVTVATEFGYLEARVPPPERLAAADVIVTDPDGSPLGNLSNRISIHPDVLLLMPGETKQIRYAVDEVQRARMDDMGYAGFFNIAAEPRQYVRQDQLRAPTGAARTARVSTRIPGVYVPGDEPGQLSAVLESVSGTTLQRFSTTVLIQTENAPFVGQVVVRGANEEELGRSDLLVYTRSRVRMSLSASPGAYMTLHFIPRTDTPTPPPVRLPINP